MQDKCPKCGEPLITKTIKKELGLGSIDYPIALVCPKCGWSKDLTGAGDVVPKPEAPPEVKKEEKPRIAPAAPEVQPKPQAPAAIKKEEKPEVAPAAPKAQPKPKPSSGINKLVTIALAILVIGGLVWAFFIYPTAPGQTGATKPTATPTITQTPVQTQTPVPEVTPTGKTSGVKLDRYRGFFNLINGALKIKPGDNVIWTNEGSDALTLVSPEGLFEDRPLNNGKRTNYTFLKTGTYNFYLKENTNLKGTIIVEP